MVIIKKIKTLNSEDTKYELEGEDNQLSYTVTIPKKNYDYCANLEKKLINLEKDYNILEEELRDKDKQINDLRKENGELKLNHDEFNKLVKVILQKHDNVFLKYIGCYTLSNKTLINVFADITKCEQSIWNNITYEILEINSSTLSQAEKVNKILEIGEKSINYMNEKSYKIQDKIKILKALASISKLHTYSIIIPNIGDSFNSNKHDRVNRKGNYIIDISNWGIAKAGETEIVLQNAKVICE